MLGEARRLVRPGGTVAVFDGDYASLTFAYPDHALAKTIEEKLIQLIVANPRIMRDLPRLLPEAGLELIEADGTPGRRNRQQSLLGSRYESYGVLLGRSGLLPRQLSTTGAPSRSKRWPTTPSSTFLPVRDLPDRTAQQQRADHLTEQLGRSQAGDKAAQAVARPPPARPDLPAPTETR